MYKSIRYIVLSVFVLVLGAMLVLTGCAKKSTQQGQGQNQEAAASNSGGSGRGAQSTQSREEHKYTFQLSSMAVNVGRMEREGVAPLTPAQAKSILAVLNPLRTKSTLTQDEAKEAIKGIKQVLTEQQLTEIGKMNARSRQGGRQGQRGGGQRSGQQGQRGGQQGQRPQVDPATMKNFNPFNPPKDSPMQRGGDRMKELFESLEKKATGA